MNKKFFTLLAASCAAMAVNAQTITYGTDGTVKAPAAVTDYTSKVKGDTDARRPYTIMGMGNFIAELGDASPVAITKLENVNDGPEARLFQLRYKNTDGKVYFLAMQWNDKANKYQLVLIDASNAIAELYFIEETLWQVSAVRDKDSKDLKYTLINKAAQLPLQVSQEGTTDKTFVEGAQIAWSWSSVADNGDEALTGKLIAAVDKQSSIILKAGTDGAIVALKKDRTTNDWDKEALTFSAYEALPVDLSAAQINAMMTGTEAGTTVQFNMNPQVAPGTVVNPLTSGKFQAFNLVDNTPGAPANKYQVSYKDAGLSFGDFSSDLTDGYVILAKEGKFENLLRVDTVYHNMDEDARYELKLTTEPVEAPREAYVIGKLLNKVDPDYKADYMPNMVKAGLQKQALFRFIYNPSTQAVFIQAKQYVYKQKEADFSWWKLLYNNENTASEDSPSFTKTETTDHANYDIDGSAWLDDESYKLGVDPSNDFTGADITPSEAIIGTQLTDKLNYYVSTADAEWRANLDKNDTSG